MDSKFGLFHTLSFLKTKSKRINEYEEEVVFPTMELQPMRQRIWDVSDYYNILQSHLQPIFSRKSHQETTLE